MIFQKKNRFKPLYKQFLKLRENVQNRPKILKFKKQKWRKLIQYTKKKLKRYKKFRPQDQTQYLVSKYPTRGAAYKKRFFNTLRLTKKFNLYYGGMSKNYIKKQIRFILSKKQTQTQNSFENLNLLFLEHFESRLDTVLYRSKFARSMRNARQLIVHGKIFINKTQIKTPSYLLKIGDIIQVNPNYSYLIEENLKQTQTWPLPAKHLLINYKTMEIIFGDIKRTNLSVNFLFYLDIEKILINYYRH